MIKIQGFFHIFISQ